MDNGFLLLILCCFVFGFVIYIPYLTFLRRYRSNAREKVELYSFSKILIISSIAGMKLTLFRRNLVTLHRNTLTPITSNLFLHFMNNKIRWYLVKMRSCTMFRWLNRFGGVFYLLLER